MFKTPLVSFQFASHFALRFVCRFALRFCADSVSKSGANLIAIPHKLGFNFARFLLSFCTKLSTHVVLWVHRFRGLLAFTTRSPAVANLAAAAPHKAAFSAASAAYGAAYKRPSRMRSKGYRAG